MKWIHSAPFNGIYIGWIIVDELNVVYCSHNCFDASLPTTAKMYDYRYGQRPVSSSVMLLSAVADLISDGAEVSSDVVLDAIEALLAARKV